MKWKTGCNQAESSKEGYGSKRAVSPMVVVLFLLLMMMMMMMMTMIDLCSYILNGSSYVALNERRIINRHTNLVNKVR
jgi:hypothetical protein